MQNTKAEVEERTTRCLQKSCCHCWGACYIVRMHLPFLTAQGHGDGELLLFMKPSLSDTLSGLAPRGSMNGSVTRLGYRLLNACSTHTTVPRIYWLVSHLRAVPTQGRVRAADACTGALESIGARARPALARRICAGCAGGVGGA